MREEGARLRRWLGTEGLEEKKKRGLPNGRGTIILIGIQKALQKMGLGDRTDHCFLYQGTL